MSHAEFPIFRITVIGSTGCGKTSLVTCFVNNTVSTEYKETLYPTLYHKLVRLTPEDDEKGNIQSLILEIEDTYGSERTDDGRSIVQFLDIRRKPLHVPSKTKDFTPFSIWKPPLIPSGPGQKYYPITIGRMGFILVFDANSNSSFEGVLNLHALINEYLDNRNDRLKPVISIVATKIDKDPECPTFQSIITQAETYSQKMMIRFWKVSAFENKNVKRMFKDMIYLIQGNQLLWMMEPEEQETEKEEEESECVVM